MARAQRDKVRSEARRLSSARGENARVGAASSYQEELERVPVRVPRLKGGSGPAPACSLTDARVHCSDPLEGARRSTPESFVDSHEPISLIVTLLSSELVRRSS